MQLQTESDILKIELTRPTTKEWGLVYMSIKTKDSEYEFKLRDLSFAKVLLRALECEIKNIEVQNEKYTK